MKGRPTFPGFLYRSYSFFRECRSQFLSTLALNSLILLPIVLFVHRHIDDYRRSFTGYAGWTSDARPLADLLYFVVGQGPRLVPVAPLYQLMSLVVLSGVCVVAARAYGIRSPSLSAVATVPLMGQPYFLENLSFGFDSLAMSLALACSVLAAVVVCRDRSLKSYGWALLLLTSSHLLYQPAGSAFLVFGLLLALATKLAPTAPYSLEPSASAKLIRTLVCYACGLLLLMIYAKIFAYTMHDYAEKGSKIIPFDQGLFGATVYNVLGYLRTYKYDWQSAPLPAFIALLIGSLLAGGGLGWRRALFLIFSLLAILLLAPGAALLLAKPPIDSPRTLPFLGILLSGINLQVLSIFRRRGWTLTIWGGVAVVQMIFIAWFMVFFSFAYGHASDTQMIYETGRLNRLIDAISKLEGAEETSRFSSHIRLIGTMPKSIAVQNAPRRFPVIDRLLPAAIDNNDPYGIWRLQFQGAGWRELEQASPSDLTSAGCGNDRRYICSSEYVIKKDDDRLTILIR
jgi:hypothetical protein